MKQFDHSIQYKHKLQKTEKISIIAWALANNMIVSPLTYGVFILIDFTLQLLLLLCVYWSLEAISIDVSAIELIFELHGYDIARMIQEIAALSFCAIISATLIVLFFRSIRNDFYKEKNLLFKILSFSLSLLRTFALTYILTVLACNFMHYF